MSSLLRPPQPPSSTSGRERGRGRGRGRGGTRGRGRGVKSNITAGMINVGVLVRYADFSHQQGRFKWPSNITERQALFIIIKSQTDKDLSEIIEIEFNQTPRAGVARIAWMDVEPMGHYYLNQTMYGEGGIAQQMNNDICDVNVEYDPDLEGIQYKGDLNDCYKDSYQNNRQNAMSTGPRYDPNMF